VEGNIQDATRENRQRWNLAMRMADLELPNDAEGESNEKNLGDDVDHGDIGPPGFLLNGERGLVNDLAIVPY
jgi:hypothetical protein